MVFGAVGVGLIGLGIVILLTGGDDRLAGWVPIAIGGFFLVLVAFGRLARGGAEKILSDGPAGTCEILSVRETGVFLNQRPRLELQVRITRPDGTVVERTVKRAIGHDLLGRVHPGAVLPIRFALNDYDIWLFDRDAPAHTAEASNRQPGLVAELERLAELHRSGALSDLEFTEAKKRLLG